MNPFLLEAITKNDIHKFHELLEELDELGKKLLLNQRSQVSIDTTLHLACRFGHVNLVANIVGLLPELVMTSNAVQETPVHEACRRGDLEVVDILVAANPWMAHWVNDKNQSALYIACENGHSELVRALLVKYRQMINLVYFEEIDVDFLFPCFLVALSKGFEAVVYELIEAWPRHAQKADENGHTLLHHACKSGNSEITRILLTLDPNLASSYDNCGFTPLHIASINGNSTVFKDFDDLAPYAFLAVTATNQDNVLHLMVHHNQVAAFFISMQFVGTSNVLFNTCDTTGNNVLHLALSTKCLEVAEYLLYKATSEQLEIRNYAGFTAMDILEMSNQADLVTLHLKDRLLNRLVNIELAQRLDNQGAKRSNGRAIDFISDIPSQQKASTTSKDDEAFSGASLQSILVNGDKQEQVKQWIKNHVDNEKFCEMMKEQKEEKEKTRQRKMQEMHMEALQNARNTIVIIAVLIATVTYTGSLSPPGGFLQEGPHIGKPALGHTTAFKVFAVSNDIALFLSLCIVIVLVSVVPFRKGPLRKLLAFAHKVLWLAISFLSTAYLASRWATMRQVRQERQLSGIVLSICGGLLGTVFLGSGIMIINSKLNKSKWRKQQNNQADLESALSIDSDMKSCVTSGFHWY